MIDPFKADMILDKIKKVFNVDIDFTNIDERYFEYILYKYQSKDITEFEDKIVEVEISKDEYKSKIAFNMNELFYYKFDLFETILLSTVFNFYKHIYDNKYDKEFYLE